MDAALCTTKSTIKVGEVTTLSAIATYGDASTADLTAACMWSPADVAVAYADRFGYAPWWNEIRGVAPGTTTITCERAQGVTGSTAITVTP